MAEADRELGVRYGVALSVILAIRADLKEGVHWTSRGGTVSWTDAGEAAVATALGLEKKEGGGAAGPSVPLKIARVFPSQIWVRVTAPDGRAADVRVRDNLRLRVAMKIDCKPLPDGRWECTHPGQAVPLAR